MLWHKEHTFTNEPFPYVKQTNVVWRITEAFPNEGDLTRSFPPEKEEKESYLYKGKPIKAASFMEPDYTYAMYGEI